MTVPSALVPILLLGTAAVMVQCLPLSFQRNDTVERRWETLFSRSMGEKKDTSRDSDYLLGIKRQRRLYCNVGIGFHIQVLPDGRINGMHSENRYSLLELSPVEVGVVSLYGVKSGMFVAMNAKGKLYGSETNALLFSFTLILLFLLCNWDFGRIIELNTSFFQTTSSTRSWKFAFEPKGAYWCMLTAFKAAVLDLQLLLCCEHEQITGNIRSCHKCYGICESEVRATLTPDRNTG
ncbi:hypothetical protein XELAEV_18021864mg [Xenopus laevis]|uniref:Fibroblast growth factor n=1 Tax=Xenopus laevis TaxID=8355 RepID=A0A974D3W2_XENLA|nr:hypothetical protein XELAEV_18021864mg [Xenopus laevis]